MKKSIKILTLVLSLALICGALVVAAFADDTNAITGIRIDASGDFEAAKNSDIGDATSGNVVTELDQDNGAGKVLQFKHQVGGDAKLVKSPYEDNHYVTVEWGEATSNSGHFLENYTVPNGWDNLNDDRYEHYDEIKYYVVDFDVAWFDVANYDNSGSFYPYTCYSNPEGARQPITDYIGLNFKKSDGQIVASFRGGDGTGCAVGNEKWSHITWIMEPIVITDESGENNLKIKQYLAVDGEIVGIHEWINPYTADQMYNKDRTHFYTLDVRLDVFGRKLTSGCVDNYNFRTFLPEYNGNLATVLAAGVGADLTAFESNLYNADKMPFGKLVATVGETYYDSIEKAVAGAAGAAPVVLKGNVTAPVVIDQAATIECGEYTIANVLTGKGINMTYNEETKTYTFEETQDELIISWGACTCGLDNCDDTHPGNIETIGWPGTTMATTYTKDIDWKNDLGADVYVLTGWKNADTGEMVDINAVITSEMCSDIVYIELIPVIEKQSADISYVKGGTVKYATGENAFKTAIDNADDGSTITVLANMAYTPATTLSVNKNITIDLNGHVLDMLTTYKGTGWLNIGSGKTFTVLGEKEGSALIAGYSKDKNAAGGTLFTSGDNATITLKGKGLLVSCGALYGKWADLGVTINIEDCYINHNNGGENTANIYVSAGTGTKSAYTLNIKNATVKGLTAAVNCPNTTVESVVNIENSVILSTMLTSGYNSNTVVNVKGNSYVYGSLAPAKAVNVTGENNYFTSNDWVSKATFAAGAKLVDENLTVKHENYTHPWVVSAKDAEWDKAATLVIAKETESKTYTYTVAVSVDVNFYDGETLLGTVAGKPGATVIGPVASFTPVANGWVNATKSYVYTVSADAAGTVNVDIKDLATETVYTIGAPKLYLNFDISDNLTGNLYVPATLPEGIEDLKVYQNTIDEAKLRKLTGNYTIGGEAYVADSRWPGANNADDPQLWIITFTYEGTALTLTLDANITDYAKKVYSIYEGDAERMEQMTALLQFVSAANAYAGYVPKGEFNSLYEQMKAKYTVREVPVVEGNIDALSAYLGGATLYSGYNSGLQFAIKNGTYVDANGDTQNVSFKIIAGGRDIGKVNGSNLQTGNFNLALWTTKTLTIQVLDVDGVVLAEGEYSLAAYYNSIKDTTDAKALALAQAIYALGAIGSVND